jgi:hypothetical protein
MASNSLPLPSEDQCLALTDEQCFKILEYYDPYDPKGLRAYTNWGLAHQPELVRLYMARLPFPRIEFRMSTKPKWP